MKHNRTILIAGTGRLPVVVAERLLDTRTPLTILSLPNSGQTWPADIEVEDITLENCMRVLSDKRAENWTHVVMAGGTGRPTASHELAKTLPFDFSGGDDQVLRQFVTFMEDGLKMTIVGAADIAPELVTHGGSLTTREPGSGERDDIEKGFLLAREHGMRDAGQTAVVADKQCLGLEPAAGTDALIMEVAERLEWPGPPAKRSGVLVKCRKPLQDRRIDTPAIGPDTVKLAASIGLAGVAIESGEVILLDQAEAVEEADGHGIFIWSQEISS